MAKKKKPSRKSEPQIALESQFRKVRSRLLQNLNRMEKRGYDISGIKVPAIPKKITPGSIRVLERLNEQRYPKAKYTYTEIKTVKGEEKIVEKKVSGTKGREVERKISAIKGVATRKQNKADKEARTAKALEETTKKYTAESLQSSVDYGEARERREQRQRERQMLKSLQYTDEDVDEEKVRRVLEEAGTEDEPDDWGFITQYNAESGVETLDDYADILEQLEEQGSEDYYSGEYSIDPSTGEVRKTSELTEKDKSGKTWIVLQSLETAQELYTKAMQDLDVMIQYEGTTRDGYSKVVNIHNNAQAIKDFIQESFAREPERTAAVLRNMMDQDGFHTVDFMYATGGYQRFLKYYNSAFVFEDIEDED